MAVPGQLPSDRIVKHFGIQLLTNFMVFTHNPGDMEDDLKMDYM